MGGGFAQLKKRSFESQLDVNMKKEVIDKDEKRRKKALEPELVLPQKKRVLPPASTTNSPAKKNLKSSSPQEEIAANETLIRETEAALKNLSGSWPRGSNYSKQQEESPAFENLFEEKKANAKFSPSSASNSSSDNACSLKDVITLRDQHDDEDKGRARSKTVRIKQEVTDDQEPELKSKSKHSGPSQHYDPPDFNELVDDSSNELEIDMSEGADKDESNEAKGGKRKSSEDHEDLSYRPPLSMVSPFSTTSAFRPLHCEPKKTIGGPLGPYPEEATFVGYSAEEKSKIPLNVANLKQENPQVDSTSEGAAIEAKSPDAMDKHYTILQPASAGSRAASALQEAAREGVPTVSAVSSSNSSSSSSESSSSKNTTGGYDRMSGTLSPTSLSRGKDACY